MKIALVTDSTSVITKQEAKDNNIIVLPIPIIIGNKEYLENIDITSEQLFEMQKNGADFPKTSQPSMGDLISLFERLHYDGYEAIIAITLSSGISGFYHTLCNISKNNPKYNLHAIDTKMTVRLQGELTLAAAKMIKNGVDLDTILKRLEEIRGTIDEIFVPNDLQNLKRGGRLSNAEAFIGSMLNIKPLLTFKDGNIVAFDKIRSMKRAFTKMQQLILSKIATLPYKDKIKLFIIDSNDSSQVEEAKVFLKENFPGQNISITKFSPGIATHLGEKSFAIGWMIDIDKIDLTK
ncbi:EDD domain protein, DegV family [Lactobacillus bombicola]|uniref:DegV family protein n=1 Tax=Lactobacillus bombicola TaxID=1505723 RepID=A0A1I1R3U4_9LACO|nr:MULTISPECIES: DegV family protein [Lactobacillus]RHW50516.1 DegV family protein [Lactobacillus bombicola]RHW52975.1 DegV family protein [Lactobacillus bombicola]RHW54623.1 DegV family protein [Lactobacillus bombicola]RMC41427.1 DegV family protein [Lactobacillus sp. ESL0233]SFD28969.1 EDD domain protein, DegV family [Lactobacillus bombicola]